jgi:hypothetical protein
VCGGAAFVDACTVSGLGVSGVGVMDVTAAKDEDGGGGHAWGINLRGVCVGDVGQRRVGAGGRKGGVVVEGREEDGVEEKKENRPSKGGRSQIGCDAS